ncbi:hypothetical protein ACQCSX_22535 (plasmid) [Pseudarthrobacter sp. P1]|uniref:hypothetical protein n=1 Tax=Pseudarthrobacter sp. P1 TaxID=3418418 RepID=UPI003CE90E4D
MKTLSSTYILTQPTQFRVTEITGDAEIHYIGITYDNHYGDRPFTRYVESYSYEKESFPIIGCYLVEALNADGSLTRDEEIVPPAEFRARFQPTPDPEAIG